MSDTGSAKRGRGRLEELRFEVEDDYDEQPRRRPARPQTTPKPPTPQQPAFSRGLPAPPVAPPARSYPSAPQASPQPPAQRENSLAGMVFVPTEPMSSGARQAQVQLRRMQDGRRAVLAYTTVDLLVAGCGPHQGWMAAPAEQLESLQPLLGFDVIALNVDLPEDWRVDLAGHAEVQNGAGR